MSTENKLDSFAVEAAREDKAGGFMDPPAKKKRGRPKKQAGEPSMDAGLGGGGPAPQNIVNSPDLRIQNNKEFLGPLMEALDNMLWPLHETYEARLSHKQKELIVTNGAICMEQYLPGGIGQHMPAIMLCFGLGGYGFGIYNARKAKLAEFAAERERRREALKGSDPGAPTIAQ